MKRKIRFDVELRSLWCLTKMNLSGEDIARKPNRRTFRVIYRHSYTMTNIPNNLYQRSMKFGRTKRNGDKSDRKAVYNITFSNSVVTIPNTQRQAETILRTRVRIYVCIVYI